jgi:holdfast attachment protein HfaA
MARPLTASLAALFAAGLLAPAALAQSTNPSEWSRPYGQAPGSETRPYSGARTAGNRVVINGIIQTGVGVSAQAQAYANANASAQVNLTGRLTGGVNGQGGYGPFASSSAYAVGNQLNVIVNGNYNTVVVNSRQTNNGDVTANANASATGAGAEGGGND